MVRKCQRSPPVSVSVYDLNRRALQRYDSTGGFGTTVMVLGCKPHDSGHLRGARLSQPGGARPTQAVLLRREK